MKLFGDARAFRHFRAGFNHRLHRPPAEAYLRLRTLPGEQAQVDWGHFGKLEVGRAKRTLWGFVMVLSYSRRIFLRFYLGNAMAHFLDGHVRAFSAFGGVARVLLYDNLKSAVIERVGQAIRFNPTLLDLAAHYHFEPRPVAVARGNEKGRVERAIRYIRTAFFAAREFSDLGDLNHQAELWCSGPAAAERTCAEDRRRTVAEVFADEKETLLGLPGEPYPVEQRTETKVGRTPYVRFDLNDYSVPHVHVRRSVVVLASLERVRITRAGEVIAHHPRSWDKGEQVEVAEHVKELVEYKAAAKRSRGLDRLHHACPSAAAFFAGVANDSGNLGATTTALTRLLDQYGADALEGALQVALANGRVHLPAVRHILDQQNTQPPPVTVTVADPRARDIVVRPHRLDTYDQITASHHHHQPLSPEQPQDKEPEQPQQQAEEEHRDDDQ